MITKLLLSSLSDLLDDKVAQELFGKEGGRVYKVQIRRKKLNEGNGLNIVYYFICIVDTKVYRKSI